VIDLLYLLILYMFQVSIRDGKLFSTDMMVSYVNLFKPKSINFLVSKLLPQLKSFSWYMEDQIFSPYDVINDPKNPLFGDHMQRIMNSDLKFPIFIDQDAVIIDGAHRLAKAFLLKKKFIKCFVFGDKSIQMFKIKNHDSEKDFQEVANMHVHDFIDLFLHRFINKKK
jgi:disulfide oxidoreductase YuzD